MTRDHQRLTDYLAHILEAIERIEAYVSDMDELAFLRSKLVQDAVISNFEVIGEASNNIGKGALHVWARHGYGGCAGVHWRSRDGLRRRSGGRAG